MGMEEVGRKGWTFSTSQTISACSLLRNRSRGMSSMPSKKEGTEQQVMEGRMERARDKGNLAVFEYDACIEYIYVRIECLQSVL